jgi:hypothetical protein
MPSMVSLCWEGSTGTIARLLFGGDKFLRNEKGATATCCQGYQALVHPITITIFAARCKRRG